MIPKMIMPLIGSTALAQTCEDLSSFLGNFGTGWRSDCSLVASGSSCSAKCDSGTEEDFFCSCNQNSCYWVPDEITLQQPDWSLQAVPRRHRNRQVQLVESYQDAGAGWGALWRLKIKVNSDLNWGWALKVNLNTQLANVDVESYSLRLQFKLAQELLFQNSESNVELSKDVYDAYLYFSGSDMEDFDKFTKELKFELSYYEINVLATVTEDLVGRLASCVGGSEMANDVFTLKFDYSEEEEYEYEAEYEEEEEEAAQTKPNIVLVTIDDLGMGDVSWLNEHVQMPNLDSLAGESIVLTQAYGHVQNTQSRAALITGKYAWEMGLASTSDYSQEKAAYILDEEESTLGEFLQQESYRTHFVGQWGLGFCAESMTPVNRGYHGFDGTFDHVDGYTLTRDGVSDSTFGNGTFSSEQFGDAAVNFLESVEFEQDPFFLHLSFNGVARPLVAEEHYVRLFPDSIPFNRRVFLAMVLALDVQIGRVVQDLKNRNKWNNSILIVQTLSGADDSLEGGGSNWPYRGRKGTPTEGGTKLPSVIISPMLKESGLYQNMFHMTDWFPTVVDLVNPRFDFRGDGVSHKKQLFDLLDESPRESFTYDVTSESVVLREENLKFYFNVDLGIDPSDWTPPPEGKHGFRLETLFELYKHRQTQNIDSGLVVAGVKMYLFDLEHDPLELINIANMVPDRVNSLRQKAAEMLEAVEFADTESDLYVYGLRNCSKNSF